MSLRKAILELSKDTQLWSLSTNDYYSSPDLAKYHPERLRWLGDHILQTVATMIIYHECQYSAAGELTLLRAQAVRKESLARAAVRLGISDLVADRDFYDLSVKQQEMILEQSVGFLAETHLSLSCSLALAVVGFSFPPAKDWYIAQHYDSSGTHFGVVLRKVEKSTVPVRDSHFELPSLLPRSVSIE